MSNIVKKIMVSAIKARMKQGENLKEILESYPKLTKEEKEELKKVVV